ncbi:MAG: tRNA (adenosine(37)-N6)-threonylcarbamoyltransferase complex dimerization subunit type 1 TsaB [Pirellula sp.]|nr:tRNA (adenosine(37)-N6)-threonylcarbamoyltransferase complex dimerization subunit type 1 TsaB [Pirellula sp.]
MRILALETSGLGGSVALFDDATATLNSVELKPGQRSAQALAPAIQNALTATSWLPTDVESIAVTVGPGSFTGLRIGVTTAKTLAYALDAALIGVNSLDVLACAVPTGSARLWAVLDAHRGQLFAASYRTDSDGCWQREDATTECSLPTVDDWLAQLQPGEIVTGPILARLKARLPTGVIAAPEVLWQPQAAYVANVGARLFAQGHRDDLWNLVPYYGRLSAAEEKRDGLQ